MQPELCQTLGAMAERKFIVLKYQGKVPAMASCEKCQRKFFTPAAYSGDADGAYEYLSLISTSVRKNPRRLTLGGETPERKLPRIVTPSDPISFLDKQPTPIRSRECR